MYQYNKYTECLSCYDNIDENNFVLYKINTKNTWNSCFYCSECIKYILNTKWKSFIKMLEELDCKATFKRILDEGLPNKFKDIKIAEEEIESFYYDGKEQSSKYKNDLTEKEVNNIINNIKSNLEII